MKRPRAILYLALLLTLCLTAGAVLSVGNTQARLADAATVRNTVLLPQSGGVSSDCLVSEGTQIVLLGDLASGETVSAGFTLETTQEFSGQLVWYADEGTLVQLGMDFALLEGEGSLSEDHLLEMKAGSRAIVTLTITAPEAIPDAQTADVQVICGGMQGIFRVELTADPPEATEPEESPDAADPEETTPTEESGSVNVILPGEPGSPIQTTANLSAVELKTLGEFEMTAPFPVKATVSAAADRLRLGLEGEPLPPMTRYSTDGGQTWYLLYDGGYIELTQEPDGEEETQWVLLLDISMTALDQEEGIFLEAQASVDDEILAVCYAETIPRAELERTEEVRILMNPGAEVQEEIAMLLGLEETSSETETEEQSAVSETETGATEGSCFRVPLPLGWGDCDEIRFWAEILTETEDGTIDYVKVAWDPQYLNAVTDPAAGELIVYMGAQAPTAGTYRLTLECMYEGICFHRMQTTFFINYSTPSDARSEEVPENE